MLLFGPSGTRNYPTDRNPARIVQGGAAAIGAGTSQTFVDYTVPTNRRAEIRFARAWYIVTTALAAGQVVSAHLDFLSPVINNVITVQSIPAAAVNDRQQWEATALFLAAGDRFQILGTLAAGAGVASGAGGISGVEYDA